LLHARFGTASGIGASVSTISKARDFAMRKLEKIVRQVRRHRDVGKVLLATLIMIWLIAAASMPVRWTVPSSFEGFDDDTQRVHCGIACGQPMLFAPASLVQHVEHVEAAPLGTAKAPNRPSRFGFDS
jgi:hypothetical protein